MLPQQLSHVLPPWSGCLAWRHGGRRRHLVAAAPCRRQWWGLDPRRTRCHCLAGLITTVQIETRTSPRTCALSPRNEISWELTSPGETASRQVGKSHVNYKHSNHSYYAHTKKCNGDTVKFWLTVSGVQRKIDIHPHQIDIKPGSCTFYVHWVQVVQGSFYNLVVQQSDKFTHRRSRWMHNTTNWLITLHILQTRLKSKITLLWPLFLFAGKRHIDDSHQLFLHRATVFKLVNLHQWLVVALRADRKDQSTTGLQLLNQLKATVTQHTTIINNNNYYYYNNNNNNKTGATCSTVQT